MVVGDCNVGKTAFCKVAASQDFPSDAKSTIGSDYFMRTTKNANGVFQFNLFDMSGDPTYVEVRNEFYKESQVLIIMFDVSRRQTFDALEMWLRELTKHAAENANMPIFVVGNKIDLDGKRAVQKSEAEKWTTSRKFAGYSEASAKDGKGFLELFGNIASHLS